MTCITTPGSPSDQLDWNTIESHLPQPVAGGSGIVSYARRSCNMEEQSIRIQHHQIENYASLRDWQIAHSYVDDSFSGRSDSRPQLRQLQRDILAGRVSVLIIDRIDRLYRNLGGLLCFVNLLNERHVSLISVSEGMDLQSQWGKLTLFVLGGLAEIYVDRLAAETQKGKRLRAKEGFDNAPFRFGYCAGNCSSCTDPNGFNYCPLFDGPDRDTHRVKVPHPIESLGVHLIFALYERGFSGTDIASLLNDYTFGWKDRHLIRLDHQQPIERFAIDYASLVTAPGEPPLNPDDILAQEPIRFRTKGIVRRKEPTDDDANKRRCGPGLFDADAVLDILANRFYIGDVTYDGGSNRSSFGLSTPLRRESCCFGGRHKPLVSRTRFDLCERIRRQRGSRAQNCRRRVRIYPLSGLLHCAQHRDHTFRALSSGDYRYYESRLCHTRLPADQRHHTLVKAETIEQAVFDFVGQIKLPQPVQERILAFLVNDEGLDGLLRQKQQIAEQMRRTRALYADRFNPLPQDEYDQIMRRCRRDLERLGLENRTECAWAKPYLDNITLLLKNAAPEEQNRLLRILIAAVYIHPHSALPVEFKVYPSFRSLWPASDQDALG